MSRPKLSVVCPVYKNTEFLKDAIESVYSQIDTPDFEFILVQNKNDRDFSKFGKARKNFKIVKIDGKGVSKARNAGILVANGEWICFIDSDDLWLQHKMKIMKPFLNDKNCFLFSDAFLIDEKGKRRRQTHKEMYQNQYANHDRLGSLLRFNFMILSSVCVKKETLLEAGMFCEELSISEDYDLWIRIASKNELTYLDKPLVEYRIYPWSSSKNAEKYLLNGLMRIKKNENTYNLKDPNGHLLKKAYSKLYSQASIAFLKEEKRKSALDCSLKSRRYDPYNGETYVLVILSILPRPISHSIFQLLKKFR